MDIIDKLYLEQNVKVFFKGIEKEGKKITFVKNIKNAELVINEKGNFNNGFNILFANNKHALFNVFDCDLIIATNYEAFRKGFSKKFHSVHVEPQNLENEVVENTIWHILIRHLTIRSKSKIIIRIPDTTFSRSEFHSAIGLKREFEKRGYQARILILPEWYLDTGIASINLLGDHVLNIKKLDENEIKFLWVIQNSPHYIHKYLVKFHWVFSGSHIYDKIHTFPTHSTLYPATDPDIYYPKPVIEVVMTNHSLDSIKNGFFDTTDLNDIATGKIVVVDDVREIKRVLQGLVVTKDMCEIKGYLERKTANHEPYILNNIIKKRGFTYKERVDTFLQKINYFLNTYANH